MEFSKRFTVTGLLAASAFIGTHALAAYGDPVPFNRPGYASTELWDISDAGTIVGASDGVGFLYSAGAFTTLVHPGATVGTVLTGIANDGTVVGAYRTGDPAAPIHHSFIYRNGAFESFDLAGSSDTLIRHISADGRYLTGVMVAPTGPGFVFDRDTAVLTVFSEPGDLTHITQGANAAGLVTGGFSRRTAVPGPLVRGAYVHDLGTATTTEYLEVGGLAAPRFRDINDQGVITGFAGTQAFVGAPGNWQVFAPPGADKTMGGYGLNNAGTLVGWTYDTVGGTYSGWTSSPVPEPATWALMAMGAGVLAWRSRRRHA